MKLSHIALSLSLALSAPLALAQNAAPAAPGAPAATRSAPVAAQTSGNVARFIVGPGGHVRGLVLSNGAVVMTHPRGGDDLTQRVRVGQPLRVEGFTHPGGASQTFFHATLRAADGSVIAAPPARPEGWQPGMGRHGRPGGEGPEGGHGPRGGADCQGHGGHGGRGGFGGMRGHGGERGAHLAAMPQQTVNGTVQQVLAGPRGGVHAMLLNNNTSVFVPHPMMPQLRQRGVRVGESVRVTGRGTATPQGTGVVAESLTFADGTTLAAPIPAPPAAPSR